MALRPGHDPLRGGLLVVAMAGAMWLAEAVDSLAGHRLDALGISPRSDEGLLGIVLAPFLHVGWGHLMANTVPFLAMGATIALGGLVRVAAVTVLVAVVSGTGTWLTAASGTDTVGASGIVFGYGSYLIARGAFSREPAHLAVGVLVGALWGSALLGGLVPQAGISWQAHLFGALGGLLAARALARRGASRRRPPAPAATTR